MSAKSAPKLSSAVATKTVRSRAASKRKAAAAKREAAPRLSAKAAKELAAAKARHRRLLRNRPPCQLTTEGGPDLAEIRRIVESVGGFDDIFPLPPRTVSSRPPPFSE